jgi:predicted small secreted protein
MSHLFKNTVLLLLVAAFLAVVGSGCQTANGFGKDVEKAGQGIQEGTK